LKVLKGGVVGVGFMGRNHLRLLVERDDVEVIGIADISEEALKKATRQYGIKGWTDYHKLLALRPDFVVIAVPTSLHYEVAKAALDAKIHVLVEKPIAATVAEGERMIEAAERAGTHLVVGHIERYNPLTDQVRRLIESDTIGQPLSISSARMGPMPGRIQDVDILLDFAIHDIDIISYFFGQQAQEVYCVGGALNGSRLEYASLILRFPDQRAGMVEASWHSPTRLRKIFIIGTKGFALGDFLDQSIFVMTEGWQRERPVERQDALQREHNNFIESILGNETPKVSARESLFSLKAARVAQRSAQLGKMLSLNEEMDI
jgi:UDP-N-acetylglucosamine 3-dehydrogenase